VIAQDQQGALTLKSTVCDISIKSDFDGIRTVIPDRFIAALSETTRVGKITQSTLGPMLSVAPHTEVVGASLRQPETERLPTRPDDFRVTDPDKDGRPGITIRIEGLVDGDIYVVQRGRDAYAGRFVSDDRVRGTVQWSAEQVVLDSTSIFLGDPPPTRPHNDPSRSSFEMVRLDDAATCSKIASGKATIFR
jgi:hypothetical protein